MNTLNGTLMYEWRQSKVPHSFTQKQEMNRKDKPPSIHNRIKGVQRYWSVQLIFFNHLIIGLYHGKPSDFNVPSSPPTKLWLLACQIIRRPRIECSNHRILLWCGSPKTLWMIFHKSMLDYPSQRGLHTLKHKYYFWRVTNGENK